jgi:hypothetical protein
MVWAIRRVFRPLGEGTLLIPPFSTCLPLPVRQAGAGRKGGRGDLKDLCFLKISPLPSLPKRGTKNDPQNTLKSLFSSHHARVPLPACGGPESCFLPLCPDEPYRSGRAGYEWFPFQRRSWLRRCFSRRIPVSL